jgi:hypothetical protein
VLAAAEAGQTDSRGLDAGFPAECHLVSGFQPSLPSSTVCKQERLACFTLIDLEPRSRVPAPAGMPTSRGNDLKSEQVGFPKPSYRQPSGQTGLIYLGCPAAQVANGDSTEGKEPGIAGFRPVRTVG